jgi:hypothetical protein
MATFSTAFLLTLCDNDWRRASPTIAGCFSEMWLDNAFGNLLWPISFTAGPQKIFMLNTEAEHHRTFTLHAKFLILSDSCELASTI